VAARRLADRLKPADVQKIENAIPARLEYFEGQGFDLTPLVPCGGGRTAVPSHVTLHASSLVAHQTEQSSPWGSQARTH
jgi:hypothetical protein